MRIVLIAPTFDPLGHVEIHAMPGSETETASRRVSRVKTLDGGVAMLDMGYTDGDRSMRLVVRKDGPDTLRRVSRLMSAYSEAYLSARAGFFRVAIQSVNDLSEQEFAVSVLVIKKESA